MNRVPIPSHWSPEQALAVYEFLHLLTEQLWHHYQRPLIDLLGPVGADSLAPPSKNNPQQLDLFDSEKDALNPDELPF